ncbi:uncharacterized protein HKW66_Vig0218320 [Vigna angularis]|uniref:Uncharacterized protein n=1 Tax=Phaseolus angularis TaxID=3914 RepID=A0A8T0JFZ1_PHAAN|nr:uncharacterized protein HKW66_Vig0218320 [Vigna angularis]
MEAAKIFGTIQTRRRIKRGKGFCSGKVCCCSLVKNMKFEVAGEERSLVLQVLDSKFYKRKSTRESVRPSTPESVRPSTPESVRPSTPESVRPSTPESVRPVECSASGLRNDVVEENAEESPLEQELENNVAAE